MKRLELFKAVVEFIELTELPVTSFVISRINSMAISNTCLVFRFTLPEFDSIHYSRMLTFNDIMRWTSDSLRNEKSLQSVHDSILKPIHRAFVNPIVDVMFSRDEVKTTTVDKLFNDVPRLTDAKRYHKDYIINIVMHPKLHHELVIDLNNMVTGLVPTGSNEKFQYNGIEITIDDTFSEEQVYIFTVPPTYRVEQPELLPPTIRKVIGASNEHS